MALILPPLFLIIALPAFVQTCCDLNLLSMSFIRLLSSQLFKDIPTSDNWVWVTSLMTALKNVKTVKCFDLFVLVSAKHYTLLIKETRKGNFNSCMM